VEVVEIGAIVIVSVGLGLAGAGGSKPAATDKAAATAANTAGQMNWVTEQNRL
jgi:hypothetical protein